jgi:hypothetical protein
MVPAMPLAVLVIWSACLLLVAKTRLGNAHWVRFLAVLFGAEWVGRRAVTEPAACATLVECVASR